MSELPRGWVEATLGEVCQLQNGRAYKQEELLSSGKYPVLRVGNFFTSQKWYYSDLELEPTKYCDDGDLLYAWSASFGPRIWSGGKVIFHYHIWRVDLESSVSDRDFVFHWFNWDKENIKAAHGTGSTMIHVTKGDMEQRRISLPPLAEQKRIVAKLDALNAKSARARTELARIETLVSRYKQAVLSKAFSGELTREWRKVASTTWPWRSEFWGDCGETLNGRAFPSGDYCDSGVRLLRPGNLGASGDVFWNEKNSRFLPEKYAVEFPKHFIRGEAILINLTAQSLEDQFLARACLSSASDEFMLNQRIGLFRPGNMIPKFCLFALKSARFRSFVDNGMNSGSLIQHVHTKQLEQYKFDVPDIEEQHEIVRRIESAFAKIDRLAKEAKRALGLVGRLDEAILAKAFRGELVPQDEGDEPAKRLLARIRAEREAAPKGKRGRGAKG